MRRVVAPLASGVLSALGLIVSERRRDVVESVLLGGDALTREAVAEAVGRLGEQARARARRARGRAARRATTCATPARPSSCPWTARSSPSRTSCARAFDRAHEERYGYSDPDAELELVTVRVAAALPGAEPPAAAARAGRAARLAAGAVRRRAGSTRRCSAPARPSSTGPAIFELPGATLVVPPGLARALGRRRGGDGALSGLDPVTLQVMLGALRAACDEMGAVLVRSAHSANIKERRDASTALFDERGRMVMQAEHIPVHLGAMPSAVAAVLDERARAGRRLDPQRPLPRRHPPAGHHGDRAALPRRRADRVRGEPRPPRRRRRARARQHAGRLALARGRGRRDLPHPARRATTLRELAGPDAQPAPARGRPARPARRRPRRRRAGRGADRAVRARQLPGRARGDARLRRAPHPRAHRRAAGRRARGERRAGGRRGRPRAAARGDASRATRSRSTSRAPPTSTAATSTARSP